ncbi:MAG: barstar family protein [Jatrophihabitantaceae bacterium]
MTGKATAIRAIYAQVDAPQWAAANLDALADVLRDLSWLPIGPVWLVRPELGALTGDERQALLSVLDRAATESTGSARPVRIRAADERS